MLEELGELEMKEIITALYKQAKKGNVKAIQEVLDRYYGKSQQNINHSGEIKTSEDIDLSNLTKEEKIQLGTLRLKAKGINND